MQKTFSPTKITLLAPLKSTPITSPPSSQNFSLFPSPQTHHLAAAPEATSTSERGGDMPHSSAKGGKVQNSSPSLSSLSSHTKQSPHGKEARGQMLPSIATGAPISPSSVPPLPLTPQAGHHQDGSNSTPAFPPLSLGGSGPSGPSTCTTTKGSLSKEDVGASRNPQRLVPLRDHGAGNTLESRKTDAAGPSSGLHSKHYNHSQNEDTQQYRAHKSAATFERTKSSKGHQGAVEEQEERDTHNNNNNNNDSNNKRGKGGGIGRSTTSLGGSTHHRDKYTVEAVYARHAQWLAKESEKAARQLQSERDHLFGHGHSKKPSGKRGDDHHLFVNRRQNNNRRKSARRARSRVSQSSSSSSSFPNANQNVKRVHSPNPPLFSGQGSVLATPSDFALHINLTPAGGSRQKLLNSSPQREERSSVSGVYGLPSANNNYYSNISTYTVSRVNSLAPTSIAGNDMTTSESDGGTPQRSHHQSSSKSHRHRLVHTSSSGSGGSNKYTGSKADDEDEEESYGPDEPLHTQRPAVRKEKRTLGVIIGEFQQRMAEKEEASRRAASKARSTATTFTSPASTTPLATSEDVNRDKRLQQMLSRESGRLSRASSRNTNNYGNGEPPTASSVGPTPLIGSVRRTGSRSPNHAPLSLSRTQSTLAMVSREAIYPPESDFDFIQRFEERLRAVAERNTDDEIALVKEKKYEIDKREQQTREEISEKKDARREQIYVEHQSAHERKHLAELGVRGTKIFPLVLIGLFLAKCQEALRLYHCFDVHRRLLAPIVVRRVRTKAIRAARDALTEARLEGNPMPTLAMLRASGGNPKENFFASWSDRDVEFFISLLTPKSFSARDVVMHAGDMDRVMYIVTKGTVEVQIKKRTPKDKKRNNVNAQCFPLPTPTYVGEFALLCKEPRGATIVCRTDVDAWCIGRADFELVLKQLTPSSVFQLDEVANNRRKSNMEKFFPIKEETIKDIIGFSDMSDAQLKLIVKAMQPHVLRNGTTYLAEDEYRPEILYLADGIIEVSKPSDLINFPTRRYRKGFCYGVRETLFLQESSPFQLKVVESAAEVWLLTRADLNNISGFFPGSINAACATVKNSYASRMTKAPRVPRYIVNDPFLRHVLSPAALQSNLWQAHATPMVYSHGDMLLREGMPSSYLYFVARGTVEIRYGANMGGHELAARNDEITADPELGGTYSHRSVTCTNLANYFPQILRVIAPWKLEELESAAAEEGLRTRNGSVASSATAYGVSPAAGTTATFFQNKQPQQGQDANMFAPGPRKRATGRVLPSCPEESLLAILSHGGGVGGGFQRGGIGTRSSNKRNKLGANGGDDHSPRGEDESATHSGEGGGDGSPHYSSPNGSPRQELTSPNTQKKSHRKAGQGGAIHSSPRGLTNDEEDHEAHLSSTARGGGGTGKRTKTSENLRPSLPHTNSNPRLSQLSPNAIASAADEGNSPSGDTIENLDQRNSKANINNINNTTVASGGNGEGADEMSAQTQALAEVGFVLGSFEFAARRPQYVANVRCTSYCEVWRVDVLALLNDLMVKVVPHAVRSQPCNDMLMEAWSRGGGGARWETIFARAVAKAASSSSSASPTNQKQSLATAAGTALSPVKNHHSSSSPSPLPLSLPKIGGGGGGVIGSGVGSPPTHPQHHHANGHTTNALSASPTPTPASLLVIYPPTSTPFIRQFRQELTHAAATLASQQNKKASSSSVAIAQGLPSGGGGRSGSSVSPTTQGSLSPMTSSISVGGGASASQSAPGAKVQSVASTKRAVSQRRS